MDLAPVVKTFVSAAVFPQEAPPHPPQSRLKADDEHRQGSGVWPGHGHLLAGGGVGLSPSLVAAEPTPHSLPGHF